MTHELKRSITLNKINYAEYVIDSMNLKSTTVLIQLFHLMDNIWLAHYLNIDENGNRTLEQKNISGIDKQDLVGQFGISLLPA